MAKPQKKKQAESLEDRIAKKRATRNKQREQQSKTLAEDTPRPPTAEECAVGVQRVESGDTGLYIVMTHDILGRPAGPREMTAHEIKLGRRYLAREAKRERFIEEQARIKAEERRAKMLAKEQEKQAKKLAEAEAKRAAARKGLEKILH